jgi:hypothetical protein
MAKTKKKAVEGPLLEALTHRLSRCPREFLEPPRTAKRAGVDVAAVVTDLIRDVTLRIPSQDMASPFSKAGVEDMRWLQLVLVVCWLLHDDWFRSRPQLAVHIPRLLEQRLPALAAVVTAEQSVLDSDRREELVRFCLDALGLRPQGETPEQAGDRFKALDSIERLRVLHETRKAQARARKLREAMKKKKAREAAAKVMRE